MFSQRSINLVSRSCRLLLNTGCGNSPASQSQSYTNSRRIFNSPFHFKIRKTTKSKPGQDKNAEEFFGSIPAGGYALLIIPVSTLCLGVWQVFRWRWKLDLIAQMERKVFTETAEFPYNQLEDLHSMEYQKVKVRGSFNYSKEIILGPRSLLQGGDEPRSGGLISTGTQSGYHVITPFKLEDTNITILVNRGWIPVRNPGKFTSVSEPVEITGVVRRTENRSPFMAKNSPERGFWLSRDIVSMAKYLCTEEAFLDLSSIEGVNFSSLPSNMVPVPRQTRVTLRNEHVVYFITWFSLSAITSCLWHRRFIIKKQLL